MVSRSGGFTENFQEVYPMDDEQTLYEKVRSALYGFFKSDCDLLDIGANERSITHKLAEHLQRHFKDLKVDCEYNRHGCDTKKLRSRVKTIDSDDLEAKTVFPDIIVHRRRNDECNLLVIEAKKNNNTASLEEDRCKLREFTRSRSDGGCYEYKFGLLLVFDVGKRKQIRCVESFKNGEADGKTVWDCLQGFPFDER